MESLVGDFREVLSAFSMAKTASFSVKSALTMARLFLGVVGPIVLSGVQRLCRASLITAVRVAKEMLMCVVPFIPFVDRWYKSNDKDSFRMIKEEGILCGGSSGAAMSCALQAVKDFGLKAGQRCVVILPDSVRNYMTKFLSDDWMRQRGFLQPEETLNMNGWVLEQQWWCELSVSSLPLHMPVSVTPSVTVQDTLDLLTKEGFDQMPVVDGTGYIHGVVTVSHILDSVVSSKVKPDLPVSAVMFKQFKTIKMDTKLGQLSRMLNTDQFVLVVQDQRHYSGTSASMEKKQMIAGIATRIDLLNFIASRKD